MDYPEPGPFILLPGWKVAAICASPKQILDLRVTDANPLLLSREWA
jgi:hypothetical protein